MKLTTRKQGLNSAHSQPYFPAKVRLHVDSTLNIYHVLSYSYSYSSFSLTAVAHEPEGPGEYFAHHTILHHFWLAAFLCGLEGGVS